MDNLNSSPSMANEPAPEQKPYSFFREVITFLAIALLIVLPFRMFIAEPYIVSGTSMFPTFDTGHYLIVDKISYRMHVPERYDVVVMIFPKDKSKDFIKRIIGLPGETVNIKNGQVTIVNKDNPKGLLLEESSYVKMSKKDDTLSKTLGPDEYFVMGDNRAGSYDSRYWGALSRKEIIGKPILRLLPIQQIGLMPGAF